MEKSNIITFKKRRYPKKNLERLIMDDFEDMVKDVRKKKLNGFMAIVWLDGDAYMYDAYTDPVDANDIIATMEIHKQIIIKNLIENSVKW